MTSGTIIVIEDDLTLRTVLTDNLHAQGWTVHARADGASGLDCVLETPADLVVLDVMLPEINGYEICRNLRQEGIKTPILMLTAKGQDQDIITGLELGADDYLVKPFALPVLLARVRALLRRTQPDEGSFTFDQFFLDPASRRLSRDGEAVDLSPKEFDLLAYFLRSPDRALSRASIVSNVWGNGLFVTQRSVDRCIKTLRQKLAGSSHHIQTVRSIGYRWNSLNPDE